MRALHTLYGVYALTIFGIVFFGLSAPLILLGPTLSIRRACGRAGVHLAFLLIGAPIRSTSFATRSGSFKPGKNIPSAPAST